MRNFTDIWEAMRSLWKPFKRVGVLLAVLFLCLSCSKVPSLSQNPWEVLQLPTANNLMDLAFSDNLQHGWVVGSNSTLLETTDGGETWQPKELELLGDAGDYRLNAISFSGQEGWIVGEPPLLLHTEDEGNTWTRIPLSTKLPGNPNTILALGPQTAEMTTDVGAIYKTTDGGQTWQALVQQAVGVIRNIARSPEGKYITVSSNGSFYSIWSPGEDAWEPHNRNSSRRVQSMGFTQDGGLWMLARGGQLQFTDPENPEEWMEPQYPELSTSWGLLDLAYRTPEEIWVAGGSGNLLCSFDGGKTWQKDREIEDVPSNFYKILFLTPEKGFAIGQRGILLRYNPKVEAA